MSAQTLADRELKDVWVIVAYPNMKPKETLQSLIDNFVFETEQLAKDEAQRALKQDKDEAFWGYTAQRKSLVLLSKEVNVSQKAAPLPMAMSAFRKILAEAMIEKDLKLKAQTMTMDDLAGYYADFFKSGKTFEDWFKEWVKDN
jgi:hypothetical protein